MVQIANVIELAVIQIVTAPVEAVVTVVVSAAHRVPFSAPIANVIRHVEHQKPTALQVPAVMASVPHVPPVKYWARIAYATLPAGAAGIVKWVRAV